MRERSKTIGIRVTKVERARLTKIAKLKGTSLSEFLRSAAVIEARRVLEPKAPEQSK